MTKLVTVYMQVYNTKKFLKRAIDSVLNQTYTNLQFILVDNGCTDGSSEIIKEYADKDPRIIYIRYSENRQYFFESLLEEYATGEYFTLLDSDDWWEIRFLEEMVGFAQTNNLDIVSSGSIMHYPSGGEEKRPSAWPGNLIMEKKDFPQYLPYYHWFLRANWGNLYAMRIVKNTKSLAKLSYGRDTLYSFHYLRQANRMGVLGQWLHHYQLHVTSSSYHYNPDRFEADVVLYDDLIDFLSAFGTISADNRDFVCTVYANALLDTISVISRSKLTSKQKFEEYCRIAQCPETKQCYANKGEAMISSKQRLLQGLFQEYSALKGDPSVFDVLHMILKDYCPNCAPVVHAKNFDFFAQEVLKSFVEDDLDTIINDLFKVTEIQDKKQRSKYISVLWDITRSHPFFDDLDGVGFISHYKQIYQNIFYGNYAAALEQMTDLLMEDGVKYKKDQFLNLYLKVSAVLEYAPAYIYGKVEMGYFYLHNNNKAEASKIAKELIDMRVADIDNVKQFLSRVGEI